MAINNYLKVGSIQAITFNCTLNVFFIAKRLVLKLPIF